MFIVIYPLKPLDRIEIIHVDNIEERSLCLIARKGTKSHIHIQLKHACVMFSKNTIFHINLWILSCRSSVCVSRHQINRPFLLCYKYGRTVHFILCQMAQTWKKLMNQNVTRNDAHKGIHAHKHTHTHAHKSSTSNGFIYRRNYKEKSLWFKNGFNQTETLSPVAHYVKNFKSIFTLPNTKYITYTLKVLLIKMNV